MGNTIELLAPAGSLEAFTAAVENGADAIYMGGRMFSARQYASNFTAEEMQKAIDYAHVRDVNVYLTMNTLLDDGEVDQAVEYLRGPYECGIDGLIVQDLGFAAAVRKCFPDLELHASTQMTIYNLEGVQALEKLGFKRVVLARELSLEEIKDIANKTKLEIEIFIHGAMCVSYSGQCLMSSMIGGRSGNRGKCAQPCRQKYNFVTLEGAGSKIPKRYYLSPKDLCSADFLDKVADTGIKSLKIEGRMKSPEYVAVVVGTYRKYLDKLLSSREGDNYKVDKEDMSRLTQIFNRGGFSKGYFMGKTGKDMMCFEKPKNWGIYLGETVSYHQNTRRLKLKLDNSISIGDGVEVWNGEDESPGNVITDISIDGKKVEKAEKGQTAELGTLSGRISKGDKVYKTSDKKLNESARETFSGKFIRKAPLDAFITVAEGEKTVFRVVDNEGHTIDVTGDIAAQTAIQRPLQESRIREQLSKTGATPFYLRDIEVKLKGNPALPISELNNLRRKALDEVEKLKIATHKRNTAEPCEASGWKSESLPHLSEKTGDFHGVSTASEDITGGAIAKNTSRNIPRESKNKISVYLHRMIENYDYSTLKADRVHIPFRQMIGKKDADVLVSKLKEKGKEVFIWLPSITRGNYDNLIKTRLGEMVQRGIDGITIGNFGTLELVHSIFSPNQLGSTVSNLPGNTASNQLGNTTLKLSGNYSLNAFNTRSVDLLNELGLGCVTLSPELNMGQIGKLKVINPVELEAIVYGRIIVMTSEYCPSGSIAGGFSSERACAGCGGEPKGLRDRKNAIFPVFTDRISCTSSIYNNNVLFVPEICSTLRKAGISLYRLDFLYEPFEEMSDIVTMYYDIIEYGEAALKDYSQLISNIKDKGFTKGHYFRGV